MKSKSTSSSKDEPLSDLTEVELEKKMKAASKEINKYQKIYSKYYKEINRRKFIVINDINETIRKKNFKNLTKAEWEHLLMGNHDLIMNIDRDGTTFDLQTNFLSRYHISRNGMIFLSEDKVALNQVNVQVSMYSYENEKYRKPMMNGIKLLSKHLKKVKSVRLKTKVIRFEIQMRTFEYYEDCLMEFDGKTYCLLELNSYRDNQDPTIHYKGSSLKDCLDTAFKLDNRRSSY